MVNKSFLAALLLLRLTFPVNAQEENYFLDTSGKEPHFYQRLTWSGDEDEFTLCYEVVIQKDDGQNQDFLRKATEDFFIEVSLPPGKYRYLVISQGLLGRPGESSEWRAFEVLPAYQPVVNYFSPGAFKLDRNAERILTVFGSNLSAESEIYLRNDDNILVPARIHVLSDRRVRLYFSDDQLLPAVGVYEIYVRNPGGLETSKKKFTVVYSKPIGFFWGMFWKPAVPIYGEMKEAFGSDLHPAGMMFNLDAISSKQRFINVGMGITASVNFLETYSPGFSAMSMILGINDDGYHTLLPEVGVNVLLRKYFFNRTMAATFRIGPGVTYPISNIDKGDNYLPPALAFSLNLGVSYFWYIYDIFYLETGLDYNHLFTETSSGFIKPWFGFGWHF
jgi:hypothetical protein